jgi:hypothetical protein
LDTQIKPKKKLATERIFFRGFEIFTRVNIENRGFCKSKKGIRKITKKPTITKVRKRKAYRDTDVDYGTGLIIFIGLFIFLLKRILKSRKKTRTFPSILFIMNHKLIVNCN